LYASTTISTLRPKMPALVTSFMISISVVLMSGHRITSRRERGTSHRCTW
jgi:hypothetical protein